MNPKPSLALFKHLVKNNLVLFVEKMFVELYPGARYLRNWHIEGLVNVLEQIIAGSSTRSIVNLPPQFLKSMICSVALPAFLLGIDPTKRFFCVKIRSRSRKIFILRSEELSSFSLVPGHLSSRRPQMHC